MTEPLLTKIRFGITIDSYRGNSERMTLMKRKLRIFTWHIHGSYLYYLSKGNFDIYIPVSASRTNRNIGRGETFPFGKNVIEVGAEDVRNVEFDCILFQTADNYLTDQYELLSDEQRRLPRIYLEHDPPRTHPTDAKHFVKDRNVLLVHVTQFNRLMWDNNGVPTTVIEHGVPDTGIAYKGNKPKGIVVINNLPLRGRLLGFDIFEKISKEVPLDLVGMGTEEIGLGEVLHPQLPQFISEYRFFFNPIRYTSFGLAVCEAMMIGLPIVGLATTEMPAVFTNEMNGIVHNDPDYLIAQMNKLIHDRQYAERIGLAGQQTARTRFNINRFTLEWEQAFNRVIKKQAVPVQ